MAGILFVHAGDDFAREIFHREGRAYWSREFPVVLEKHGYLAFECAGPDALTDPDVTDRYDIILIARLPDEAWDRDLVQRLIAGRARTIAEGPLPMFVERAVGVTQREPSTPNGLIRCVSSPVAHLSVERFGTNASAQVGATVRKASPWPTELDWRTLKVPISLEQAMAWARPSWDPVQWSVDDASNVIALWTPESGGPESPAAVQRGSLVAWSLSVFSYLVWCHTAEPYQQSEYMSTASPYGLEALLLSLLDILTSEAGGYRYRILPWPLGAQWALTIRHDFDRPLRDVEVQHVLAEHDRCGTAATWYWRPSHLTPVHGMRAIGRRVMRRPDTANNDAIREVARHRQSEVALHTELLWAAGTDESRIVEEVIGKPVHGTSAHGDAKCFRYQGAPNVLWVAQHGLDYTENLQHFHFHPYRFVFLERDGVPKAGDVFCLPKHQSFDRSTARGAVYTLEINEVVPRYVEAGGLLQIMNHPDIHVRELFDLLQQLPKNNRVDWTAARTISWWRNTHDARVLRIQPKSDGAYTALAEGTVANAVVEVLDPAGVTSRSIFNAGPGAPELEAQATQA